MKKNRLIKRLFLSLLCILTILTFTACTEGGSGEILPKEQLSENVCKEDVDKQDFVFEYLDKWNFPLFETAKIKRVETLYRKNYYKPMPDTLEHARAAAEYFIEKYYDTVDLSDKDAVAEALISSYVSTVGDRYSHYRSPSEYENYSENMSGTFVGIGVTVTRDDETPSLHVIDVTSDSAKAAGILPEDKIIAVDGVAVSELGYSKAVAGVRGDEGTTVALTVKRGEQVLTISATRVKIEDKTVSYKIEDGIGYIRITGFKSNTDEQFEDALYELTKGGVKGVVYDLRQNTGGYLSSVSNMLDRIAPKGTTLVSFSNNYSKDYRAESEDTFLIPSVVICNARTASAAELFTAGVRDVCKANNVPVSIVGVNTFGKGVMQRTYTLSDGSAVTMTVAYYNPPSGTNYDGVGIKPDFEVILDKNSDTQFDAAMSKIKEFVNNY